MWYKWGNSTVKTEEEGLTPNKFLSSHQIDYPLAEFIIACGFFIVLILERLVVSCNRRGSEETAPLLPPAGHSHSHTHHSVNDVESSSHHVHVDLQAHSSFRSFMLFLSLSLHSVFEGLAIGLQSTGTKVTIFHWVLICTLQVPDTCPRWPGMCTRRVQHLRILKVFLYVI